MSDEKNYDKNKCIMESACYAMGAIVSNAIKAYPVALSLPIHDETMHLNVCFAVGGKLCDVEIEKCNFSDVSDISTTKKFLSKLFGAVHFLATTNVTSNNVPLPFKDLNMSTWR